MFFENFANDAIIPKIYMTFLLRVAFDIIIHHDKKSLTNFLVKLFVLLFYYKLRFFCSSLNPQILSVSFWFSALSFTVSIVWLSQFATLIAS